MTKQIKPDENAGEIVKAGGIAIVENSVESMESNHVMWGYSGATLEQRHIDALLAGYMLTFDAMGEYQVFIALSSAAQGDGAG